MLLPPNKQPDMLRIFHNCLLAFVQDATGRSSTGLAYIQPKGCSEAPYKYMKFNKSMKNSSAYCKQMNINISIDFNRPKIGSLLAYLTKSRR